MYFTRTITKLAQFILLSSEFFAVFFGFLRYKCKFSTLCKYTFPSRKRSRNRHHVFSIYCFCIFFKVDYTTTTCLLITRSCCQYQTTPFFNEQIFEFFCVCEGRLHETFTRHQTYK